MEALACSRKLQEVTPYAPHIEEQPCYQLSCPNCHHHFIRGGESLPSLSKSVQCLNAERPICGHRTEVSTCVNDYGRQFSEIKIIRTLFSNILYIDYVHTNILQYTFIIHSDK